MSPAHPERPLGALTDEDHTQFFRAAQVGQKAFAVPASFKVEILTASGPDDDYEPAETDFQTGGEQ